MPMAADLFRRNTHPDSPFDRLRDVELSPIKAMELAASRMPGVVSLAQGIPSFDTPEAIKDVVRRRLAEGQCARYSVSPGLPELREALAAALAAEGMFYDPDGEIIVTAGAIEAIAATLLAVLRPGDEVLVVSPTYASYLPAIRIARGTPRFVPLPEDAGFDLDPEAIAAAAGRRTRALLLCNPNNPTGTLFSEEQTRRMLEVAETRDLLVISDEVYKDFVYDGSRVYSAAQDRSARHRVVRVCSFSKAYGMTGWRVGFVHGPRALMASVLKVHDALVTCAPVISQFAALAALEVGGPAVAQFREELRRRRARIIERLDALPRVFDYQKPQASYFVFPRVKDTVPGARDSRSLAARLLEEARVALVPGIAFGPSGESHLRMCYARPEADIDAAFERMEAFFGGRRVAVPRGGAWPAPPAPRLPDRIRTLGVETVRILARTWLRRSGARVVAVSGVQGVTVVKRVLAELLALRYRVRAAPLSHNTEVGMPLAVLGVSSLPGRSSGAGHLMAAAVAAAVRREPVDVLVLELGTRRPGDIQRHLRIVRPDIAVITRLVPRFREDVEGAETMRGEMLELIRDVRARGGPVLVCGDDPVLADLAGRDPGVIVYGLQDVQGDPPETLKVGERTFRVNREAVGDSQRYALSAALRVGLLLGIDEAVIARFLDGEPAGVRRRS